MAFQRHRYFRLNSKRGRLVEAQGSLLVTMAVRLALKYFKTQVEHPGLGFGKIELVFMTIFIFSVSIDVCVGPTNKPCDALA